MLKKNITTAVALTTLIATSCSAVNLLDCFHRPSSYNGNGGLSSHFAQCTQSNFLTLRTLHTNTQIKLNINCDGNAINECSVNNSPYTSSYSLDSELTGISSANGTLICQYTYPPRTSSVSLGSSMWGISINNVVKLESTEGGELPFDLTLGNTSIKYKATDGSLDSGSLAGNSGIIIRTSNSSSSSSAPYDFLIRPSDNPTLTFNRDPSQRPRNDYSASCTLTLTNITYSP